jgi:hypothetical protein
MDSFLRQVDIEYVTNAANTLLPIHMLSRQNRSPSNVVIVHSFP